MSLNAATTFRFEKVPAGELTIHLPLEAPQAEAKDWVFAVEPDAPQNALQNLQNWSFSQKLNLPYTYIGNAKPAGSWLVLPKLLCKQSFTQLDVHLILWRQHAAPLVLTHPSRAFAKLTLPSQSADQQNKTLILNGLVQNA